MPDTRPHLSFDEDGVCGACRNFDKRIDIDWQARREEFDRVLSIYRRDNGEHDCIVPVSGGKDSTFQVIKLLEHGMNPLCVTGSTDHLSEIGRRNINAMRDLGVDLIEVSHNPIVRRKINKIALEQVGDISWPEHVAIYTIPLTISVRMNIPLIVYGENAQNEYGGPAAEADKAQRDYGWIHEFGSMQGMRASDLVGVEGIERRDLNFYSLPPIEQLKDVGVTCLYMGYYLPWDGLRNAVLAQARGMEVFPKAIEGQIVNYENLDNLQTGIHDYFAYLKYGFGRATSQACNLVRRNVLTRQEAVEIVRQRDGRFPWTYLGVPIEEILAPIGLNIDEFVAICDQFTNRHIFMTDSEGNLVKDSNGNLIRNDSCMLR